MTTTATTILFLWVRLLQIGDGATTIIVHILARATTTIVAHTLARLRTPQAQVTVLVLG